MEVKKQQLCYESGENINSSNSSKLIKTVVRRYVKQSGSLEVIQGDDKDSLNSRCSSSDTSSRPLSTSSASSVLSRPHSCLATRALTPTKQVSLIAVRRKEENCTTGVQPQTKDPNIAQTDLQGKRKINSKEDLQTKKKDEVNEQENYTFDFISSINVKKCMSIESDEDKKKEYDESDEDKSEEQERKAPNELLMEFVDCLMRKDYKNSFKLCKMIMLFEPMNPEALQFLPLIQRKLNLDERAASESHESDGSDEDDDSDSEEDTSSDTVTDESDEDVDEYQNLDPKNGSQNPARAILNIIFGNNLPEDICDTSIDLAAEIKKLEEF
ncbi:glutamate-rich protein 2-like isoform X2 [Physella acuta]|uniref:glutamate-rich protein 2-like isoform X2 n=1 Tax=Physella acuta TaxID=109671 RepID=UPI0027DD3570|nr:glutamate-rich protein 2-like isoform X2 [Physella acuta]